MADYTLSAKITGDSSGFEKAFSTAQKTLDAFQGKLQGIAAKFDSFSKKISSAASAFAPISAAASGAGIAAGKMALDFEDSMANINTLLDDSSHLDSYENAVKRISNDTGLSLDNMSQGMYQAISSLGDGGKETERIFDTMARSAKAGGAEVSDSVALISAGMKGYNDISGETAQKISDLAFQTAKLGVTTFPEMAKSMQPLFPLANSLNLSFEDLFGSMATLTGVTGNTAEVSTQLKAVFSNLMAPTTSMQKMIEKYGYASGQAMLQNEGFAGMLEIVKNETGGQADKMAELFSSTEAVTAMTALTSSQFDTFKDKLSQMGDAAGATEAAYEKLRTNGDKLRSSWNKIKNAGVELGATMIDMVAPKIEFLSDKVGEFSNYFSKASESTKRFIVIIGTVVAAIAPVLMIMGKLASGLGAGLRVLASISSPVGIALTAISALAAGFAYLMNVNESFRDGVLSIWDSVSGKIQSVVSCLIPIMSSAFEFIKTKFQGMLDGIASADFSIVFVGLQIFADNVKAVVSNIDFSSIAEKLQTVAERIKGTVSGIDFSGIMEKLQQVVERVKEFVSEIDFSSILTKIQPVLEIVSNMASSVVNGLAGAIQGFLPALISAFETIKTVITTVYGAFKGFISGLAEGFSSGLGGAAGFQVAFTSILGLICPQLKTILMLFQNFGPQIQTLVSIIGSSLVPIFTTLGTTIGGIASAIIPAIQSAMANLLPVITQIINAVLQVVSTVLPVLVSLINQLSPFLIQIAGALGQIFAALAPMITQLVGAVLPVITNIITVLSNVISSVMPALISILNVIMSVIQTLTPIIMDVLSVVVSVVSGIISAINPIISFIGTVISAIMAIISPIVTFVADIIATVVQVIGTIIGVVTGIFSTVFSIVSGVFTNISNFISTVITAIGTVISTLTGVVGGVFNGIYSVVSSVMGKVRSFITGVFDGIKSAWSGLTSFVNGVFSGIGSAVNQLVSQVKGFVNGVISGINAAVGLINMIPGVSIGYIPYLARGTDDWQGGFARMNEGGRGELTYLPNGTQVIPHDISVKYAKEAARVNNNSADGTVIDYDRLINGLAAAMSGIKVESSMNLGGRTLAKVLTPLIDDRMGLQNVRAEMR